MSTVAPQPQPPVSRAVQRRRQLRLARIRARASLRTSLLPTTSLRRRQRNDRCTAADSLTALGVRVQVLPPATPWPRTGRFVLPDATGWLADLALVTAALDRGLAGGGEPSVICPVTIGFRTAAGYLPPEQVPTRVADVVPLEGLVVEVRCLPSRPAR